MKKSKEMRRVLMTKGNQVFCTERYEERLVRMSVLVGRVY